MACFFYSSVASATTSLATTVGTLLWFGLLPLTSKTLKDKEHKLLHKDCEMDWVALRKASLIFKQNSTNWSDATHSIWLGALMLTFILGTFGLCWSIVSKKVKHLAKYWYFTSAGASLIAVLSYILTNKSECFKNGGHRPQFGLTVIAQCAAGTLMLLAFMLASKDDSRNYIRIQEVTTDHSQRRVIADNIVELSTSSDIGHQSYLGGAYQEEQAIVDIARRRAARRMFA